jgi:hypothetical protein
MSPSNCLTITGHHGADMYILQLYFKRAKPQFHGFDHSQQREVQSNTLTTVTAPIRLPSPRPHTIHTQNTDM